MQKDVFGFDELAESFEKMRDKFDDASDVQLMTLGQSILKRVKELSPTTKGKKRKSKKPGLLKRSWTLQKPREYRNGAVRVVRVRSLAPHSHLVEYGHRMIRGGKTREKGRELSASELKKRGIEQLGSVKGVGMLETAVNEYKNRIEDNANKVLDKITEDLQI